MLYNVMMNGCFMVGHKTWLMGAKGESSGVSAVH